MSSEISKLSYLHAETGVTCALILAAGRGNRFGSELPKQYLEIDGVAILRHTLERFLSAQSIDLVRVVIHPDDQSLYEMAVDGIIDIRLLEPVYGGPSRAATTQNGLESLASKTPGKVLIHDAARPFVSEDIIQNVVSALNNVDGAFVGLPLVDALWRVSDGTADASVARDGLWRAQTPQGFWFDAILDAHRSKVSEATDDVAIARAAGLHVRAIVGSEDNFKITVASDLARANAMMATVERPVSSTPNRAKSKRS